VKSAGKLLTAHLAKERGLTVAELAKPGRIVSADQCAELRIYPAAGGFAFDYIDPETGARVEVANAKVSH
jgi:hypothetical protein